MAKKITFEAALKRLEEITAELEKGDPSLEKSLKTFDEGVAGPRKTQINGTS